MATSLCYVVLLAPYPFIGKNFFKFLNFCSEKNHVVRAFKLEKCYDFRSEFLLIIENIKSPRNSLHIDLILFVDDSFPSEEIKSLEDIVVLNSKTEIQSINFHTARVVLDSEIYCVIDDLNVLINQIQFIKNDH